MKYCKNFKKIICFILLYTIFTLNTSIFYIFANEIETIAESQTEQPLPEVNDPLNLKAKSAVLIDAKTGIIVYEKNKDAKSYPASTTKILTALIAIENTKKTDILTHSHNAIFNIGQGSSHIGMRENEQITMEQALNGVLLASANEVCMAIAEKVSGSVDNFVNLMNKRAKEIGTKNTHFANPHGFHDDNHYTTSYDMALIMQEAIKNLDFLNYISTTTYKIPTTNIVNEERILHNSNKLIQKTSPHYYQYCVGGKTGYTNEAGNTLVTYAKKDNIELIAVVMQDEGTSVYDDTKKLYEYGFSMYEKVNLFDKSSFKEKAEVAQKFKDKEISLGSVYLRAEKDLSLNLPKTIDFTKIRRVSNIPNPYIGAVNIGDKIGSLDFMYDNKIIASIDLLSENKMELIPEETLEKKEKIKNIFKTITKILKYGLIIFIVIIILLIILSNIIKAKRRKRRYYSYKNKKLKPMRRKKR